MDILKCLFHFNHRLSFPFTLKRDRGKNPASLATGTYVVCLDCGREFAYNLDKMKVLSRREARKLPKLHTL